MKQVIFIALALILSVGAYAQEKAATIELDRSPRWMIKTDIFYPSITRFNTKHYGYTLIGEYGFKGRKSFELITQHFNSKWGGTDPVTQEINKHYWANNKITLMYKYYFGRKRPYTGFYVGGNTMLLQNIYYRKSVTTTKTTENKSIAYSFMPGVAIGYQNYIKDHLILGTTIGINRHIPIATLFKEGGAAAWDSFKSERWYDGLLMLNIGYRF